MATMIKEEQYIICIGAEEHVIRVQELLWGSEAWPERFRARISQSMERLAITVYGSSGREVAERPVERLSHFSCEDNRLSGARPS